MTLDRRDLKRVALPIALTLVVEQESVSATTKDISKKGLCVEISTTRLQHNPCNLINKIVTLHHKNELIDGHIVWYTVEGATFQIGIAIERKHKSTWKKIIDQYERAGLKSVIKAA